MALNINTTSIEVNTGTLQVKNSGGTVLMQYNNAGNFIKNAAHPMFYATGTTVGWSAAMTLNTWNTVVYDTVVENHGSSFSASTFTAPVTGTYLFTSHNYCYYTTTAAQQIYPAFLVNASWPQGIQPYRNRGHYVTTGYSFDCDISQIVYCVAGDAVTSRMYPTGSTCYYYPAYSHFAGWLLG